MKRSKAGTALIIVGLVVAIMAPVWKWSIGPSFVKIPDDLDITSEYEGTVKLYADPEKMEKYPEGQEPTIPLKITRLNKSVPEKSGPEVALIREDVEAVMPDGDVFLEWERYYALDRKTAENVAGHNSDEDRKGWYVMLPPGTEKKTYQMWDDDTGRTGPGEFVREETRDGNEHSNVTVYIFHAEGEPEPMVEPPLGLPASLSGAEIKEILNDPNLQVLEEIEYPIDYEKGTSATFAVEPRTGGIVDVPQYHEEYYVDGSLLGQPDIPIAILDYHQTNVSEVIDDAASYFGLLDLATLWVPVILLVLGLILMIIGAFLTWKGPGKKEPITD